MNHSALQLFLSVSLLLPLLAAAEDAPPESDSGAPTTSGTDLAEQLAELREQVEWLEQRITAESAARVKLTGYVDVGFFYVQGDGSGTRTDIGHQVFPKYRGVVPDSWVFLGDPLSTAVNSRGEPADTGESRAVTFDSVNAGNRPSFILNSLGLNLFAGLGETLTFNAALDVVPRGRDVSSPNGLFLGDFLDLKLGYLEWRAPFENVDVSLFAGKFDSVLGIEYRTQDAPDRLGITPSLICRYTCGRPIGVKARFSFWEETVTANVAITNGTHFVELFPLYDEVDRNFMKTASARLSYRFDIGSGVEIGVSGAGGAQDAQPDSDLLQWHVGVDLKADVHDVLIMAEFVRGVAPGRRAAGEPPCGTAQCLSYRGAYGLVGYRINSWLTPYARVDWRHAQHQSGASFVYESRVMRVTAGGQVEFGPHLLLKAEYILNRELAPLPAIPDDVFTSSLVARF